MSAEQVQARLAEMSAADLQAFAASPDQVQFAAGLEEKWYFIILASLILIGMVILTIIMNNKHNDNDVDDNSSRIEAPIAPPEPT